MSALIPLLLVFTLASPVEPKRGQDFTVIDIYVTPNDRPLAAYQLRLEDTTGELSLVGVEGGSLPFSAPPAYDPEALQGNIIILAAFELNSPLSAERTHVARLHVMIPSSTIPHLVVTDQTVTDVDGNHLDAQVDLLPGEES